MGMIFNTDETLDMIHIGHRGFRTNWATLQGDPGKWVPAFRNLGTGGPGSTYATLSAAPLNIDHPSKSARWQMWLLLLDGGVASIVGGFIADAIKNTGHVFSGVEFFIVPARPPISASFVDVPDQNPTVHPGTSYRKCIAIKTTTVDGLHP